MSMVKRNGFFWGVSSAVLLLAGVAHAGLSATKPAGLLVFPKLVVTENEDTLIQVSNTADEPVHVRCYLVNANAHCSNNPQQVCSSSEECGGGICIPGWSETDFRFTLTRRQPIVWRLSEGLPGNQFPLDGIFNIGPGGQFNQDSNIPPAPEFPFQGEMKCFQVDENDNPVARNDLKGEVTLVVTTGAPPVLVDVAKYNAIGLGSLGVNDGNDTLCLGGNGPTPDCPEAEYDGCPNILIVDHFFDGAPDPQSGTAISSNLTLVPCSQDFLTQSVFKTTVQFLVFNEFEQRLSTSIRIQCFDSRPLSDIDTRAGTSDDFASIFNIAVQGTLAGQSRLRAVQTSETDKGHGILAVLRESHGTTSAAVNVHFAGIRDQGDVIRAPRQ
ncbi:MAG: hypothetical protein KatS3mg076_1111 [Candidatus Binatia bacterium]|nr:MAG: hypothetical protein KatS3mg076_1111 [Candidatus Binatia bacterium]